MKFRCRFAIGGQPVVGHHHPAAVLVFPADDRQQGGGQVDAHSQGMLNFDESVATGGIYHREGIGSDLRGVDQFSRAEQLGVDLRQNGQGVPVGSFCCFGRRNLQVGRDGSLFALLRKNPTPCRGKREQQQ